MRIAFVELRCFRKLNSIRIDFAERITLCVGANNSGKTSAMIALDRFLVHPERFNTHDFTLSNWSEINRIGRAWQVTPPTESTSAAARAEWEDLLPSLDLWLTVSTGELHLVRNLIPSLDWKGGLLGIRVRLEPKMIVDFGTEFVRATKAAVETKEAAAKAEVGAQRIDPTLWPTDLHSFMKRKLRDHFHTRYYILDPGKCETPECGVAKPQPLPAMSEPLEANPLTGLIRVNVISAQRGFGDSGSDQQEVQGSDERTAGDKQRLSRQLRNYYTKHLDPTEFPVPSDLRAIEAIETAEKAYDERLAIGLAAAINELETLNYPGVTDPKLRLRTRLRPADGLNHDAAIQYDFYTPPDGSSAPPLGLPEEYNGLGYQNLISMVFRLMGFRDGWMRVGKAANIEPGSAKDYFLPPIHLVLIEEPEAYLHAQVQQVFVRKAYDVLRNHADLGVKQAYSTQLVVSTHSSHIAHECEFAALRYFRRLPAVSTGFVPTSAVINLSEVFGTDDETRRFVKRYLRATHCDLFFADAAILVEGAAERMLIPHFIRNNFERLHSCYITLLEIDGRHAHRLRPLIEHLGLTTLIITDLDSSEGTGHHKSVRPMRKAGQITGNSTLKTWHPVRTSLDELLEVSFAGKAKQDPKMPLFAIRVAYQVPLQVALNEGELKAEALTTTFEDALVIENIAVFKQLSDDGGIGEFKRAIGSSTTVPDLVGKIAGIISNLSKAAFALDIMWATEPHNLKVPTYIAEGLVWLDEQLQRRKQEVQLTQPRGAEAEGAA